MTRCKLTTSCCRLYVTRCKQAISYRRLHPRHCGHATPHRRFTMRCCQHTMSCCKPLMPRVQPATGHVQPRPKNFRPSAVFFSQLNRTSNNYFMLRKISRGKRISSFFFVETSEVQNPLRCAGRRWPVIPRRVFLSGLLLTFSVKVCLVFGDGRRSL